MCQWGWRALSFLTLSLRPWVWYSDGETHLIYRLDLDGTVTRRIPPGVRTGLAWDGRRLWQVAGKPKRLVALSRSGRILEERRLAPEGDWARGIDFTFWSRETPVSKFETWPRDACCARTSGAANPEVLPSPEITCGSRTASPSS